MAVGRGLLSKEYGETKGSPGGMVRGKAGLCVYGAGKIAEIIAFMLQTGEIKRKRIILQSQRTVISKRNIRAIH